MLIEAAGDEITIENSFDQHLLTPAYLANPYPYYHRLRREAPVYWSEAMGAWLLTRYRDAEAALRDPRLVSGTRISAAVQQLPEAVQPEMEALQNHISTWMGFIHRTIPACGLLWAMPSRRVWLGTCARAYRLSWMSCSTGFRRTAGWTRSRISPFPCRRL